MIIVYKKETKEETHEKSYFAAQILADSRSFCHCRTYHCRIIEGIFNAVYSGFGNHRNHGAVTNSLHSCHWVFDSDGTSWFALRYSNWLFCQDLYGNSESTVDAQD